ncbi:MAG: lipocalin-like domain-containing protein [Acidobacteria bacterium]|nr:lipocalin-like domain-containing protein [Acidobacteriota bacterium]
MNNICNAFLGAWKLVSAEEHRAGGWVEHYFGLHPVGLLIYHDSGQMAMQEMRDPRPNFPSGYEQATTEQIRSVYDGYFAYFGTFAVDEAEGTVTHYVQSSNRPDYVGTIQKRFFQFSGDLLILRPPPFEVDGEQRTRRLVWERLK